MLTFKWVGAIQKLFEGKPLRSVPVENDETHRVDPRFKGNLAFQPRPGVFTLYDLMNDAFQRYASVNCMGSRKFLGWKTPKVKEFADGVQWLTFQEMGELAHKFGAALRSVGVMPAPNTTNLEKVTTSSRIAIFENTCAQWMIACIGAFTQSITVTTVYATLGIDAVAEAVNDNLITAMVCNKKDIAKVLEKASKMKTLKTIIYTNDLVGPSDKVEWPDPPAGIKILSFDEFVALGDTTKYPPTPPEPSTCAVVMYTSGSTGKPKGVVITHSQVLGVSSAVALSFGVREGNERLIAYLPLAHILEMAAEFTLLGYGCTLCYADPKSLTATGAFPKGALEGTIRILLECGANEFLLRFDLTFDAFELLYNMIFALLKHSLQSNPHGSRTENLGCY